MPFILFTEIFTAANPPGQYFVMPADRMTPEYMDVFCESQFGGYAARIADEHELGMVAQYLKVNTFPFNLIHIVVLLTFGSNVVLPLIIFLRKTLIFIY